MQVIDAVCALPGANPGVAALPCRSDRDRRAICARTCIARHPPVPTHIQSNQSGLMGGTLVEGCAAPGPPKSFPGEWKWPPSKDGRI